MSNIETIRHSAAHLLAMAVLEMFPEAQMGTGPSTDNGFYYDFLLPRTLIPEDLPLIEKKMKHLAKQKIKYEQYYEPIEKSIEFLRTIGQDLKVQIANDLKKAGESQLSFYKSGNFVDLCAGPHTENTSKTGAFKLTNISGSYFRGDKNNAQLQRIYGVCFETKDELKNYEEIIKEAKKRDHRTLGKKLDLFSFHEEGPGFPFWHPNGTIVFDSLVKYMQVENKKRGYNEIKTPPILNEELWHKSGHWANFQENMYFTDIDEQKFAIKPMNCPGGCLVYKSTPKSYKDLPLKNAEFGLVHRHELSGVLHGLFRVRSFTQDDAHIFCTEEQLADQIKETIQFTLDVYRRFGFEKINTFIATRPEKSMGSDEVWELSTKSLETSLEGLGLEYKIKDGEGAFYGPKIEFNIEDSLGRNWQLGTIQVDFSMPERFGLEYIGSDNDTHTPVMIHRAIFGSLERFIGILIEHTNGALPTFISPIQVEVLPVNDDAHGKFAKEVFEKLKEKGARIEYKSAEDSLGKRMRNAQQNRIPFVVIIGDKEVESGKLTVKDINEEQSEMSLEDLIKKL